MKKDSSTDYYLIVKSSRQRQIVSSLEQENFLVCITQQQGSCLQQQICVKRGKGTFCHGISNNRVEDFKEKCSFEKISCRSINGTRNELKFALC